MVMKWNHILVILLTIFICFIVITCATTKQKPTTFYSQDKLEITTPTSGEHIVIIYTTEWCRWCKISKNWMNKQNISYIEKNLEDPLMREELKKFAESIGYAGRLTSVPLFIIDNNIYVGYNSEQILDAIGRKKSNYRFHTTWETPLRQ